MELTAQDKQKLLNLAWSSIKARLKGAPTSVEAPQSAVLNENRGAFVSLHKGGNLRGCIGYIHAVKPLFETVIEMSQAAAFQDPRFDPLQADELDGLDIEISVLTPLEKVTDILTIEPGKHGLMIVKEPRSGLLLPQVAEQFGWDRETFLSQTCIKAGLDPDAWRTGTVTVYSFTADVFS